MHFNGFFICRNFSILRNIHSSSDHLNAKIKSLVQQGHYHEALESYSKEPYFPNHTSKFTFPSLIKACAYTSHFRYGGTLQSAIIKMGLHFDPYIVTSLIRMYVQCGLFCSALKVFDEMSQCEVLCHDVALWNSIVDGYSKNGLFEESFVQFRRMQGLNVKPDGYTLCILLGLCNGFIGITYGKELHGYVVRNGFDDDSFVITAMIDMYSNSSRPMDAWNVFQKLENRCNTAVWNSMINCFRENRFWQNALQLYSLAKSESLEFSSTTFSSVLTACSQGEDMTFASQLHSDVVKTGFESDPYVSASLITFYSKCGFVEDSEKVFYLARDKDKEVGLWNSMISAYVNCCCANDALHIYNQMRLVHVDPDSFTILNTLIACSIIGSYCLSTMFHGELMKRPMKDSVAVQSSLLTMYSKLGNIKDCYKVFGEMKEKDVVAWGSMISGSCENRNFDEASALFKEMGCDGVKPDSNVVASAISACIGHSDGKLGCCIHGLAIKEGLDSDAFTGCSLIEFYSKCGQPEMAKNAFFNVVQKNIVVWNSLISCYSQNGFPEVSVSLLPQIMQNGLRPDPVSITTVLAAVSQMAALLKGKALHGYYIRLQLPREIKVENALIDMYIKSGCFRYARLVFQKLSERDIVAWNSMISGYGSHGECRKSIELFHMMKNSGTPPDEITFLSLISSCNHCGFVDEGLHLFSSMREHGIEPNMAHYVNIVDLLGRSGRLDEACGFIENMGIAPDRGIWLSLLSACRVHKNVKLGELAARNLIETDPTRGSNYVQLLNLYVEAGLEDKAANLRAIMKEKGLMKIPGCSWIEVKNKVESFFSGDSSSPRIIEIYEILSSLKNNMKRKGCDHEEGEMICSYELIKQAR
ncbi:hypothetical protein BUALT_Bualt01G0057100 [Buddleja alternifolia]|uniref:Chlororespiratory reduction 21 n=1 Tax=Buddleja alternifolia TaxID=168488 RepID=A0AAV6Y640_9LAMI|nr:hypothetical protein BUALT_Bualt01G0057100 [Buddleja alternifolia]